jgi:hypothetical protein
MRLCDLESAGRAAIRALRGRAAAFLIGGLLVSGAAASVTARPPPLTLPMPGPADTIAKAGLTRAELADILVQVARTSFDKPDNWRTELRIRRILLDGQPILVVRGAKLLCGGTGGCETWLFRRRAGRWIDAIAGDAPVADRIDLAPRLTRGRRDLMAGNGVSASRENYVVYAYDGDRYRPVRCFETGLTPLGTPTGGRHAIRCR